MDPPRDVHSFSSISALLAALTLVLGGAVVLSGRRRRAYLAFIVLCANLFFWHLLSTVRTSPLLAYFALGVLVFVPVNLLLFLRTWLDSERAEAGLLVGVPRSVWALLVAFELTLGYAYSVRHSAAHAFSQHLPGLFKVAALLGCYAALAPLWRTYRRTISRVDKRRLLYLLGVGVITVTATAVDYLPAPIGRGEAAIGSLSTIVYLYFLQQTLFLDRLLDINELLGKVVVLSAFGLLLPAVLTVLTVIGVEPRQVVTLVAFVILILYEPLRNRLEKQVHRWTYRERYELAQHLLDLRQTLTNVIDLREAVHRVLSLFEETGRMTHASIYLLDAEASGYELAGHIGPRPTERLAAAARRPLLHRLATTRRPVTLEQLERERQSLVARHAAAEELETLDAIGRTLVELHAGVVVGIFASATGSEGGRGGVLLRSSPSTEESGSDLTEEADETWVPVESLLGLLCLKDERVSEAFAPDELDMLANVAAQLGITVRNSQLYERMKERDRLAALGEMAAGLAHEIRNPLGAIKGAAELVAPLPGDKVPDDAGEFLRIIVEETRRLNRVVSQFLDYARPFRGELVALDINQVVHKTLVLLPPKSDDPEGLRRGAGRAHVDLDLAQDLPRVRGDAEQLRQVFLNLAINAIQSMEGAEGQKGEGAAPVLSVSTGLRRGRPGAPQRIEVRFTDNGPGIAPALLKSLFIPFYTTKEKGTGLGLPISQRIVENHGGFIEVRSRLGQGSTFTVVLPLSGPSEAR